MTDGHIRIIFQGCVSHKDQGNQTFGDSGTYGHSLITSPLIDVFVVYRGRVQAFKPKLQEIVSCDDAVL